MTHSVPSGAYTDYEEQTWNIGSQERPISPPDISYGHYNQRTPPDMRTAFKPMRSSLGSPSEDGWNNEGTRPARPSPPRRPSRKPAPLLRGKRWDVDPPSERQLPSELTRPARNAIPGPHLYHTNWSRTFNTSQSSAKPERYGHASDILPAVRTHESYLAPQDVTQAPHIFIHRDHVPYSQKNLPHLAKMLRRFRPDGVHLAEAGYYIVFGSGDRGREMLQVCYESMHNERLFSKYTMFMVRFPDGWNAGSVLQDRSDVAASVGSTLVAEDEALNTRASSTAHYRRNASLIETMTTDKNGGTGIEPQPAILNEPCSAHVMVAHQPATRIAVQTLPQSRDPRLQGRTLRPSSPINESGLTHSPTQIGRAHV